MRRFRTLTALTTASLALAAAPAAFAQTSSVGNSGGSATMNVCVASIECTYVNYHNGKPTDVVKHAGWVTNWSVNAGSIGGQVQLRILRPTSGGKLQGRADEFDAHRQRHRPQHVLGPHQGQGRRRARPAERDQRHLHGPGQPRHVRPLLLAGPDATARAPSRTRSSSSCISSSAPTSSPDAHRPERHAPAPHARPRAGLAGVQRLRFRVRAALRLAGLRQLLQGPAPVRPPRDRV